MGDNVGDCAGMAADLFETFAVTVVATMLLGQIFFTGLAQEQMMLFPLLVCAVSIIGSIIGTFFIKLGASQNIMGALYKGLIATGVVSAVLIAIMVQVSFGFSTPIQVSTGATVTGMGIFVCALIGLAVTGLLLWM